MDNTTKIELLNFAMENGMIDAIGTHQELLASNAIYNEVYTSQMKGGIGDE